jgi:hypothetical protein
MKASKKEGRKEERKKIRKERTCHYKLYDEKVCSYTSCVYIVRSVCRTYSMLSYRMHVVAFEVHSVCRRQDAL